MGNGPRAVKVKFTAAHRKAGWVQHTDWHWQIKLSGGILDYWPSTAKWMWCGRNVRRGTFAEIEAFIAGQPKPEELPSRREINSERRLIAATFDTPDGWQPPCPKCGGGLFWRPQQTDPWTCDRCQKFKGRGLSLNWLTTPAWAAEVERIVQRALPL